MTHNPHFLFELRPDRIVTAPAVLIFEEGSSPLKNCFRGEEGQGDQTAVRLHHFRESRTADW